MLKNLLRKTLITRVILNKIEGKTTRFLVKDIKKYLTQRHLELPPVIKNEGTLAFVKKRKNILVVEARNKAGMDVDMFFDTKKRSFLGAKKTYQVFENDCLCAYKENNKVTELPNGKVTRIISTPGRKETVQCLDYCYTRPNYVYSSMFLGSSPF